MTAQDAKTDDHARLLDPRKATASPATECARWPNAAAVLEVLAALEAEFKSVLHPPAHASD